MLAKVFFFVVSPRLLKHCGPSLFLMPWEPLPRSIYTIRIGQESLSFTNAATLQSSTLMPSFCTICHGCGCSSMT